VVVHEVALLKEPVLYGNPEACVLAAVSILFLMDLPLEHDVLPAIVAKPRDVDVGKYEEYFEGTFEQLLDALDMSFDALVGRPQQTSLGRFFG